MKTVKTFFRDYTRRIAIAAMTLLLAVMTTTTAWADNVPRMSIEACEGGAGFIHVKGWAYDPSETDANVDVFVTFFTDEGCTEQYRVNHAMMADEPRNDIAELQNIPGNHGFDACFFAAPGNYWVKVIPTNASLHSFPNVNYIFHVSVTELSPLTGTVTLTPETGIIAVGNGTTLKGTGGNSTYIVIADDATVTLAGIDITSDDYPDNRQSGILCLGDATIILAKGTDNYLRGGSVNPPIEVGPKNKTLTMKGYGSLVIKGYGRSSCIGAYEGMECGNIKIEGGNYDLETSYVSGGQTYSGHAAAIGGSGQGGSCGNITISGGNIRAISSFAAAAIGTGRVGSCGNITITGGNIYAQSSSSQGGAAIGCGLEGNCGDISISGITSVTALQYIDYAPYCIGPGGANSTCGTLTLWGRASDYIVGREYWNGPEVLAPTNIQYTVSFDKNSDDATGTMVSQTFFSNTPQALSANGFSLSDKAFKCWSTEADGSGYDFYDGETVTNLGNVTLYAQWANTGYVVSFDKNSDDATGTMAGQNFVWNTTQVLNANTFVCPGYVFMGWNTKSDGSGDWYADKAAVSNLGSITLYAQWGFYTLTSESGDIFLSDGQTLTGKGGNNTHVVIADGATVTLHDVDITDIVEGLNLSWAGITCQGDATIILADGTTNKVKGCYQYPGIYVPQGKTLTIKGNGSLVASSSGKISSDAPGIGAMYNTNCGNIIIEGGTVTATGGYYSAGIGGAQHGTCGDITICNTVTSVTASAGSYAPYSIGAGSDSSCGTVTIGGVETGSIARSPYIYVPDETVPHTVTFDKNAVDATGTMDSQTLYSNIPHKLNACTFTRTDHTFLGWNTAPDGSGTSYADGQSVTITADVTLYAQWHENFTISFDANGGEGTMDSQYFFWNTPQALTACNFTATDGYIFAFWNTAKDGSGTSYADEQMVSNTGSMTLYAQWRFPDDILLTSVSGDILLYDGQTLSGTGGPDTHVTIIDGATVTLHDVNITDIPDDSYHAWAGITCQGDATIILEGENIIKNGYTDYPGIHVGPKGKTLTISGNGSLNVSSKERAGIGPKLLGKCGNIVINSGLVTATGGTDYAAGIGTCSLSECGDITINGGTIIATGTNKYYGVGIGATSGSCGNITLNGGTIIATGSNSTYGIGIGACSDRDSCGDIIINSNVVLVSATKGDANNAIGAGSDTANCGTITIAPELTDVFVGKTRRIYHSLTLADNADNSEAIEAKDGRICQTVTLSGRTLYMDGDWNTICLPFDLSAAQIAASDLAGAKLMELDNTETLYEGHKTGLEDGTLYLNFKDATSIEAGKPYIVKWAKPEPDLTISTDAEWEAFAANVNNGTTYVGQTVKLAADINVTAMVSGTFKGTLDGDSHTVTVNISGSGDGQALFHEINDATIMNVNVTGNIEGNERPATFASFVSGISTICNCRSSVAISSTKENDWVDGGAFVARINSGHTINIVDCVFTGSVTYTTYAYAGGGIVGFAQNNSKANLTRCFYSPSAINISTQDRNSKTKYFVSGADNNTIINCYYNSVAAAKSNIFINDGGTDADASNMSNNDLLTALGDGWEISGENVVPKKNDGYSKTIENPMMYEGLTIKNTDPVQAAVTSRDQKVTFVGQYSPFEINAGNQNEIILLGSKNTLGYSATVPRYLRTCRAHFYVPASGGSGSVKAYQMKFGEEGTETGIISMEDGRWKMEDVNDAWYDLSGRKLDGKPTQKGIYIVNGRKVIVK